MRTGEWVRVSFGVAVANSVRVGSIVLERVGRSVNVGSVGVGVGRCVTVALGVTETDDDRTSVRSELVREGVAVADGTTDADTAEGVTEDEGVVSIVLLPTDVDGVAEYDTLALLACWLADLDGDGVRIKEFVSDSSSDRVTDDDDERDGSTVREMDAEDDGSRVGESVAVGVSVGGSVTERDRLPGVRVAVSVVSEDSVIVSVSLICNEKEKLFEGVGGGVIVAVVVDDDELDRLRVIDGVRE